MASPKDEGVALRSAIVAGGLLISQHEKEPVDPVRDCLREAFGAAAPEFVGAFKAAMAKRGLVVVDFAPLAGLGPILDSAESNASGLPDWEVVCSRVSAVRAMIAKARGAA